MNSCLGLLGRRPDRLCQVNESVIGGARQQQLHLCEVTVALRGERGGAATRERTAVTFGSVYAEKGLGAEDRTHTHVHTNH